MQMGKAAFPMFMAVEAEVTMIMLMEDMEAHQYMEAVEAEVLSVEPAMD